MLRDRGWIDIDGRIKQNYEAECERLALLDGVGWFVHTCGDRRGEVYGWADEDFPGLMDWLRSAK